MKVKVRADEWAYPFYFLTSEETASYLSEYVMEADLSEEDLLRFKEAMTCILEIQDKIRKQLKYL